MGTVRLKCWMSSRGPNSVPEARPRPQFTLTNACRGCWRSPHLLLAGPRTDDRAVADGSVFADGAECRQLSDAADIELTADTESRQLEPPPSETTPNQQAEPPSEVGHSS
jgi:hypothetical protein